MLSPGAPSEPEGQGVAGGYAAAPGDVEGRVEASGGGGGGEEAEGEEEREQGERGEGGMMEEEGKSDDLLKVIAYADHAIMTAYASIDQLVRPQTPNPKP